MPKSDSFRILLVDNEPDRKERISILKGHGFMVYPALHLRQAHERCKPGAYDLVIVNAGDNPGLACELCDDLRSRQPEQLVLLMAGSDLVPVRDYNTSTRPEALLERVKAVFDKRGMAAKLPAA